MRIDRRWFVAMAVLFLPLLVVGNAYGESRYRWDIPHLSLSTESPPSAPVEPRPRWPKMDPRLRSRVRNLHGRG